MASLVFVCQSFFFSFQTNIFQSSGQIKKRPFTILLSPRWHMMDRAKPQMPCRLSGWMASQHLWELWPNCTYWVSLKFPTFILYTNCIKLLALMQRATRANCSQTPVLWSTRICTVDLQSMYKHITSASPPPPTVGVALSLFIAFASCNMEAVKVS